MLQDTTAALTDYESIGDRWGLSTVLGARGLARTVDGDIAGAATDITRAIEMTKQLGAAEDGLILHLRLSDLRLLQGDVPASRAALAEARALNENRPQAESFRLI